MTDIARSGDADIHYEAIGDAAGPVVVLVAGAGAPAEFWIDPFCASLASAGFRVVRYWNRDTGLSVRSQQRYPIDVLVADLLAVMAEIHAASYHLVGHSMGGYIVNLAATRYPEYVKSLTSISSGPGTSAVVKKKLQLSEQLTSMWFELSKNRPRGNFEDDLSGWLKVWKYLNGSVEFNEGMARDYTRALYVGPDAKYTSVGNHFHALTTVPDTLIGALGHSKLPFLGIHGSKDLLVPPDHGEAAARLVRESRFELLEGAGHMFFNDGIWDDVSRLVLEHLKAEA